MYDHHPHSFDMRGLKFAAVFLVVLVSSCAAVKYGVASAERHLAAAATAEGVELTLLATKAKYDARSAEEKHVIEQLRVYESTLATHATSSAAELLSHTTRRFIGADVGVKKLFLFENGFATAAFDILSSDAPTGLFPITSPLLTFFTDSSIHDSSNSSGIQLSPEDTARVAAFATNGMPLFVTRTEKPRTIIVNARPIPSLSARAFLIGNIKTGEVYVAKNASSTHPIASISKLLIALVAGETIPFDQPVTISAADRALTEGTPGSISASDSFAARDLLYPLLMESNNSVAYTLARYHESALVRMMNDKARAIGMADTVMEEPSGLSKRNVASASDLFALARHIYDYQSFLFAIARTPNKTITALDGSSYSLANLNHFAENPRFLGGKTGYTDEARQTMVALFDVPVDGELTTIGIVVLGSEDRKKDVEALRAWFGNAATTAVSAE